MTQRTRARHSKGSENDESLRIPFVIGGPGVVAELRVRGCVASLVAPMPTLLEGASLTVPDHRHGESVLGAACGAPPDGRAAFFETVRGTGLRSPERTYALPRDEAHRLGDAPFVAYDAIADPYQYDNLPGRAPGWISMLHCALATLSIRGPR